MDENLLEEYVGLVYENAYMLMDSGSENPGDFTDDERAKALEDIRELLGFSAPDSASDYDTETFCVKGDGSIHLYVSARKVMDFCRKWIDAFLENPTKEKAVRFEVAVMVSSLVAETDSLWENNEAV